MDQQTQTVSLERRAFFSNSTKVAAGTLLLPALFTSLNAEEKGALKVPKWSKSLGTPTAANLYGQPSPFEKEVAKEIRLVGAPKGYVSSSIALTSANSPISKLRGHITPNGLFYERNHSGAPVIDPKEHKLLIHGLVENSIVLSMEHIKRFPSIERTYFVECSAAIRLKGSGDSNSIFPFRSLDDAIHCRLRQSQNFSDFVLRISLFIRLKYQLISLFRVFSTGKKSLKLDDVRFFIKVGCLHQRRGFLHLL